MATRYSGNATIRVVYLDHLTYQCRVSVDGRSVWHGWIGPPERGFGPGIAYDSPRAYDSTARAALAFAEDEGMDLSLDHEMVTQITGPANQDGTGNTCTIDRVQVGRKPIGGRP
jgi:hypothetical protein